MIGGKNEEPIDDGPSAGVHSTEIDPEIERLGFIDAGDCAA